MQRFSQYATIGTALAVCLAFTPPAFAETISFKADLAGTNEVPPNPGVKATGKLDASYDTSNKKLSWTLNYSGLTGDPNGAHFHGPATPDKNAGVAVPITAPLTSPVKGSATLTDAQATDLMAGRWYVNVHTAAHKDGEIRGQVMKGK